MSHAVATLLKDRNRLTRRVAELEWAITRHREETAHVRPARLIARILGGDYVRRPIDEQLWRVLESPGSVAQSLLDMTNPGGPK